MYARPGTRLRTRLRICLVASCLSLGAIAGETPAIADPPPAACSPSLQAGSFFTEFGNILDGACLLRIAEHNKGVAASKLASATAEGKHLAEAEVRRWEHAANQARVLAAEAEYQGAQKAKAAVEVISRLEGNLHAALDRFEADAQRHQQEIVSRLTEIAASERKRLEDAKHRAEALVGSAKAEAEHDVLLAQRALRRAEHVLLVNDLEQAQRAAQAAFKRVGAQAEAIKARAKAAWLSAKTRLEADEHKAAADVRELENKIRTSAAKLGKSVTEIKDAADHVAHGVEHAFSHIEHLFSFSW